MTFKFSELKKQYPSPVVAEPVKEKRCRRHPKNKGERKSMELPPPGGIAPEVWFTRRTTRQRQNARRYYTFTVINETEYIVRRHSKINPLYPPEDRRVTVKPGGGVTCTCDEHIAGRLCVHIVAYYLHITGDPWKNRVESEGTS